MITHHTQLLNYLIERYGLKSYLEIGVQNPANNFDKINCPYKEGVDPEIKRRGDLFDMTSDKYFEMIPEYRFFDLIFIDGLHHADQVKRDFENSLRCLNDNGFIDIHDTLPDEEQYTTVPRQTKKWFGDVYKFAMTLQWRTDIRFVTLDADCGCTIVWKGPSEPSKRRYDPNWPTYCEYKREALHMVSPSGLEAVLE